MWGFATARRLKPNIRFLTLSHAGRKQYSALQNPPCETIKVTCGSSGQVGVSIYRAAQSHSNAPLIIYIPPLWPDEAPNPTTREGPPAALLSHHVVQIHPRWSPSHLFPQALHDTLVAYDHALTHVLPTLTPSARTPSATHPRPIGIYGVGLGGSLAAALALTESRPAQRPSVSALAVQDGIYDWSRIATSSAPPGPPAAGHDDDPDLAALYAMRERLFRTPDSAFDAFASPILFFRTTGLAIPRSFPSATPPVSAPTSSQTRSSSSGAYTSRKSHLTFPPRRSGLRIPIAAIGVSGGDGGGDDGVRQRPGVLREQAQEFVGLMRRSVMLHEGKERERERERGGTGTGDEGFDAAAEAESRASLVELGPRRRPVGDGEWVADFFDDVLGRGEEGERARG